MSKDLLALYYQDNKERPQKKTFGEYQSLFKEKKSNNMGMSEENMEKQKFFTIKD